MLPQPLPSVVSVFPSDTYDRYHTGPQHRPASPESPCLLSMLHSGPFPQCYAPTSYRAAQLSSWLHDFLTCSIYWTVHVENFHLFSVTTLHACLPLFFCDHGSLCVSTWVEPSSDLQMIPKPGPHRLPPLLCCGSPPFGELSFCPCLWLHVSETLSRVRLRVRSRGSSGWAPHSTPLVQSQPAALHIPPLLL